jgi:hypothetical protein
MTPTTYEVRVSGPIPDELLPELQNMTISVEPPETVLYGSLPDQSALFGLITRMHSAGLEVIDIRRMADGDESSAG